MTGEAPPEGLELQTCLRELSGLLWRERIALDRLADHLVAGADDTECDGLFGSISALELHRAIAAREAAVELGIAGDPTLEELTKAAPLGWADVLASHRRALVDLTNEVTHLIRRPSDDALPEGQRGRRLRSAGVQQSLRTFIA